MTTCARRWASSSPCTFPIGGLALAPLLTGWPIILGPVHIALLEMVIDPVCSLAFEAEPEEQDVMRRPPRDPDGALFPRRLLLWSAVQGVAAVIVVLVALAAWVQGGEAGRCALDRVRRAGRLRYLVLVVMNRTFRARPAGCGASAATHRWRSCWR
jgi:Ca2+-transporting ATPase